MATRSRGAAFLQLAALVAGAALLGWMIHTADRSEILAPWGRIDFHRSHDSYFRLSPAGEIVVVCVLSVPAWIMYALAGAGAGWRNVRGGRFVLGGFWIGHAGPTIRHVFESASDADELVAWLQFVPVALAYCAGLIGMHLGRRLAGRTVEVCDARGQICGPPGGSKLAVVAAPTMDSEVAASAPGARRTIAGHFVIAALAGLLFRFACVAAGELWGSTWLARQFLWDFFDVTGPTWRHHNWSARLVGWAFALSIGWFFARRFGARPYFLYFGFWLGASGFAIVFMALMMLASLVNGDWALLAAEDIGRRAMVNEVAPLIVGWLGVWLGRKRVTE